MKTNTTKLRRALTAFVLTGVMMPISDLCAADVTLDPAQAPQSVENANVVIPEGSAATINAGEKVLLKGTGNNTLNGTGYTFQNAQATGTGHVDGSIISGGNWTITGGTFTGNSTIKTAAGASGTGAYGGVIYGDKITILGDSSFVDNTVKAAGTSGNKNNAFGGAISGVHEDIEGIMNGPITIGSADTVDTILFQGNKSILTTDTNDSDDKAGAWGGAIGMYKGDVIISAQSGDSIQFLNNEANGERTKTRGGAIAAGMNRTATVTITGSEDSRVLFNGNKAISNKGNNAYGGAIYCRGNIDLENVTILNSLASGGDNPKNSAVYGGALCSWDTSVITLNNVTMNNNSAEANYVFGGAVYADDNLVLSGNNEFKNNTANWSNNFFACGGGAINAWNITFEGDGSRGKFSGNKANGINNDMHITNSITIKDAGTYSFGGGITTIEGVPMTIQNGANVTFEAGSISNIGGAVTLDNANVTIKGTDGSFAAGSMTAQNGNKLSLVYTGSANGKMLTGDVTGLAGSDMKLRFQSLEDGVVGRGANLTAEGLSTVVESDGKTFNLLRGEFTADSKYISKTDNISGLAALENGDNLIIAQNGAAFQTGESLVIPENFTIRSNSLASSRTISANGNSSIFKTAGTSALTLENITISGNTSNLADTVGGSVITSGNWIINGGTFTGNSAITVDKATGDMTAKGGAISGGQIDLSNTTFEDNHAKTGSYTDASKDGATITTPYGGAVYGSLVTVSGNSRFTGNSVSSGNPYYNGLTGKANNETLGGAIAGASGTSNEQANIDAIVIGGTDKDTITFSGNHAYALEETNSKSSSSGGAVGGALGTHVGKVTINAEAGDSITFTDNTAEAKFSRAAGGAIGAGAQDKWGTVEINADKDSTVLFQDNKAYSADGAARVMGGAIYSRSDVDVTNVTFDGNKALLENGKGGDVEVGGGAIYNHKGNTTITDSTFTNNSATGTGDLTIATGGAIHSAEASLTLTGTNTFTGNSVSNENGEAKGGAIYGKDVAFVGDGSKATFSGNTANGVKNDVHAESSVKFDGNGEYTFGGGITTGDNAGMEVNGSTLNFEAGSITDIAGTVGLKDATLNITATDETVFNARDVKFNGGNNNANLTFAGTEQWTMGADFGDALVNKSSDFTTVKSGNGKTVVSFRDATNGGSNFVAMTKDETTGAAKFQGGAETMGSTYTNNENNYTLQKGDYIIATADGSASTLTQDNLTIKSADDTVRKITGTGTILSDISSVNLKNVELGNTSSDAATITTKDLTVNADGKSAVDSINAASVKVGGNGQLIVNSTINGSTEVLTGANLAISQQENAAITGALTVDTGATLTLSDIAMTFEEVKDANGKPVLENGKPVKTPVVDAIEITDAISFADDAVIEISFDETFNLDAPGTYAIMKGTSLTNDGAEFSFVDAIAQLNNDMLQLSVVDGALMLDVKGFGTVPEPSTWALLILGGLGVFGVARKNRKAKK